MEDNILLLRLSQHNQLTASSPKMAVSFEMIEISSFMSNYFLVYLENLYRFGDGIIFTHICNMPNVSVSLKKDGKVIFYTSLVDFTFSSNSV